MRSVSKIIRTTTCSTPLYLIQRRHGCTDSRPMDNNRRPRTRKRKHIHNKIVRSGQGRCMCDKGELAQIRKPSINRIVGQQSLQQEEGKPIDLKACCKNKATNRHQSLQREQSNQSTSMLAARRQQTVWHQSQSLLQAAPKPEGCGEKPVMSQARS